MAIFPDSGPNQRFLYDSMWLFLVSIFFLNEIIFFVAGKTTQGHRSASLVEGVISVIPLCLQNVSLTGELCKTKIEDVFRASHTMDAIYSTSSPEKKIEKQVFRAYSKDEQCNRSKVLKFQCDRQNATRRL